MMAVIGIIAVQCQSFAELSNLNVPSDTAGNPLLTGESDMLYHDGLFYLYMNRWGGCKPVDCCSSKGGCASCCFVPSSPMYPDGCVFTGNHSVGVYSTSDFRTWNSEGIALGEDARPSGIEFRPHVVYNSLTKLFIMYFENREHAISSKGYFIAIANRPAGPFETVRGPVAVADTPGDFDVFVDDDGAAYHVQTTTNNPARSKGFVVTLLDPSYLRPTNQSQSFVSPRPAEGPVFFKRKGLYYILAGTTCCACKGGSSVYVFTARAPLGPYSYEGDIGSVPGHKFDLHSPFNYVTRAQGSTVITVPVIRGDGTRNEAVLWLGNQWATATSNDGNLLYWTELVFSADNGGIKQLQWVDSVNITVDQCRAFTEPSVCKRYTSLDQPRCRWNYELGVCTIVIAAEVEVFEAHTTAPWGTTYACFRVPSAVQTSDGDIFIFAESRIGNCGDQSSKDITMKVSTDKGRSWGPLQLVVGPKHHKECAANSSCLDFSSRNPYATVDRFGTIILGWVETTNPKKPINLQTQLTKEHRWQPGSQSLVNMQPYEGNLLGPGAGIVLGRHAPESPFKGRMVGCGANGYVGGMKHATEVWWSDDDGQTYTVGIGGGMPYAGLSECQVVELSNGTVMVNARNEIRVANPMPKHRAYAISIDGGQTWGFPQFASDLQEPTVSAGMININGTLYFSNPNSQTDRTHMTIKKSVDSGSSWSVETAIWSGPSAYSVLVPTITGEIGLIYERGETEEYQTLSFVAVNLT